MTALLLLSLLAQQSYPPESPPIQPTIQVLWMVLPAPALDEPPSTDPAAPVSMLWIFPGNTVSGQDEATAFCADLLPWNNAVLAADPTNPRRMSLAACLYYPAYTSTTMSGDLAWMQSGAGSAAMTALRQQYGGATVQMINTTDGGTAGIGFVGCSTYGKQWCYSVVAKGAAKGNYTSIHEWCHNMGCLHDDPNASGNTPITPYVYGFCGQGVQGRDPMVYPSPCTAAARQPRFGNPDLMVAGAPFGNATHNIAKLLREQMPKAALFYPVPTQATPLGVGWTAAPGHPTPAGLVWTPGQVSQPIPQGVSWKPQ